MEDQPKQIWVSVCVCVCVCVCIQVHVGKYLLYAMAVCVGYLREAALRSTRLDCDPASAFSVQLANHTSAVDGNSLLSNNHGKSLSKAPPKSPGSVLICVRWGAGGGFMGKSNKDC